MASLLAFSVLALSSMAAARPQLQMSQEDLFKRAAEIVGGTTASSGEFPYQVSILSSTTLCGGVLLNANTVLSAAHCAFSDENLTVLGKPSAYTIRAGSLVYNSGGTTSKVTQIVVHPSFNTNTLDNDLSLWHLTTAIAASGTTIGYPTLPAQSEDPASGSTVTVSGWGTTSENSGSVSTNLRKVSVLVVARATCLADYSAQGATVTANMFCAAASGKDSCSGDSGGPIIQGTSGKSLVGIVSWGFGCAESGFPGVYTRIGNYVSWITTTGWGF